MIKAVSVEAIHVLGVVLLMSLPLGMRAEVWADSAKVEAVERGELSEADVTWWGFDEKDSTRYLQAALDSRASRVVVPALGKPWMVEPLFIKRSDVEVFFEPGAVLEAKRGAFRGRNDSLLTIEGQENIRLIGWGGEFRMHKEDYWASPYRRSEWRHALSVRGVDGILIEGITFYNSGGDGIYLGATREMPCVRNAVIRGVVCDRNNRQGLSVISADGLLVEQSVFRNTLGAAPMAGIDLEPNRPDQFMKDVVIRNNFFDNNSQLGMHMWLSNLDEHSEPVSITVENNTIIGGEVGIHVASFQDNGPGGFVDIRGNRILKSRYAGILVRRVSAESGIDVSFTDNVLYDVAHLEPHDEETVLLYKQAMDTTPGWWGSSGGAVVLWAQRDVPQYQGGLVFDGDVIVHKSEQPAVQIRGTKGQRWVERFANETEGDGQEIKGFLGWKNVMGEFVVIGSGSRDLAITSPVMDVSLNIVTQPSM